MGTSNHTGGTCTFRGSGFTLVELLVVIGIIAVLISILIPVLGRANAAARTTLCAANMRQVSQTLIHYATSNRGQFPPAITFPNSQFWTDWARIGKMLTPNTTDLRGPIVTCPDDPEAIRSYAMNIWACSDVPSNIKSAGTGSLWRLGTTGASKLLLIAEAWSSDGSSSSGFTAPTTLGSRGLTPAARFGAGVGLNPLYNAKRWGMVNCELTYSRHRTGKTNAGLTQPVGRLNIGYADGHVATKSNTDLVNAATGLSTLDTIWSRMDPDLNH